MAGTKTASATLSLPGQSTALAPKCTGGQKATGGGFRISPSSKGVFVFESRKVGQKTWQVSAKERFAPGATVTAYVYCSRSAPSTKAKSASIPSGLATFVSADAKCTSGKAQAGGFLINADNSIQTSSYRLAKKTWRVTAKETGVPTTYTSYVYCATPKLKTKSGFTSSGLNDAVATATSAKCKSGTKALAGGFSQPASGSTGDYFNPITASAKSGRTWLTTGINVVPVAGPINTLTSYAYCG
jgi:hypothetical protein